ncbi:chromophore lyase CpcT/CpeT [Myxosarcina sp. GI1(2024)]
MKIFQLAIATLSIYLGGIYATPPSSLPDSNSPAPSVEKVVAHLEGIMDTSAQAAANPNRANVRMTTCRVKTTNDTNSNTVYLYQEQALNQNLASPYRQRLLEITPAEERHEVVSRSYKLDNPQNWNGLCDRPLAERVIDSERLGKPVCSVFLEPLVNVYLGRTQPGGCPTNYRGAVTITNSIILHARGMDTWDRGFNAKGDRVWGADETGYQYRWLVKGN